VLEVFWKYRVGEFKDTVDLEDCAFWIPFYEGYTLWILKNLVHFRDERGVILLGVSGLSLRRIDFSKNS
jgi:hypothetical protein